MSVGRALHVELSSAPTGWQLSEDRRGVIAGAQRVSVGGALTWSAVGAFVEAATAIRDRGDFTSLGDSSDVQPWLA